jgi:Fe-S oxidoreductase
MRVALFVPCYMDAFEPEVGVATLELLERLGCVVEYPFDQTCCGQPMVNTGCHREAAATEALFVRTFEGFDHIVCPSGSCVHQVRLLHTTREEWEGAACSRFIRPHLVNGTAKSSVAETTFDPSSGAVVNTAVPNAETTRKRQNESVALMHVSVRC